MSTINIALEEDFEKSFFKLKQILKKSLFFPISRSDLDNDIIFGRTCAKCGGPIIHLEDELEVVDRNDVSIKKIYFHKHHFS